MEIASQIKYIRNIPTRNWPPLLPAEVNSKNKGIQGSFSSDWHDTLPNLNFIDIGLRQWITRSSPIVISNASTVNQFIAIRNRIYNLDKFPSLEKRVLALPWIHGEWELRDRRGNRSTQETEFSSEVRHSLWCCLCITIFVIIVKHQWFILIYLKPSNMFC